MSLHPTRLDIRSNTDTTKPIFSVPYLAGKVKENGGFALIFYQSKYIKVRGKKVWDTGWTHLYFQIPQSMN